MFLHDEPETQKARRSIQIGSAFGLLDGKTRSGHIPLLLLCGDFVKKVSIAKQQKMNSEAELCFSDADFEYIFLSEHRVPFLGSNFYNGTGIITDNKANEVSFPIPSILKNRTCAVSTMVV